MSLNRISVKKHEIIEITFINVLLVTVLKVFHINNETRTRDTAHENSIKCNND